jgi:hypothetical protein
MTYPQLSGQKTVTSAGTAVALGTINPGCSILVKALETNTDIVALGNDGADDVTVSNGYRLAPGEVCVFENVNSLAAIYLDSVVNGEGVSWIKLQA